MRSVYKYLSSFSVSLLLIFSLFLSNPAMATIIKDFTANELFSVCGENTKEIDNELMCSFFFAGYLEGMVNGTHIADWNLPEDQLLSVRTIVHTFKKFLNDNPRFGDRDAGLVTTVALMSEGILKK